LLGENRSFKIVMLHMYINIYIYIYVQIMPTKVGYEFGGWGGVQFDFTSITSNSLQVHFDFISGSQEQTIMC